MVVGGVVYVGSEDYRVYALNAASGVQVWNYTTGGAVFSSPAVAAGVVYIGSDDHRVYALNALVEFRSGTTPLEVQWFPLLPLLGVSFMSAQMTIDFMI